MILPIDRILILIPYNPAHTASLWESVSLSHRSSGQL